MVVVGPYVVAQSNDRRAKQDRRCKNVTEASFHARTPSFCRINFNCAMGSPSPWDANPGKRCPIFGLARRTDFTPIVLKERPMREILVKKLHHFSLECIQTGQRFGETPLEVCRPQGSTTQGSSRVNICSRSNCSRSRSHSGKHRRGRGARGTLGPFGDAKDALALALLRRVGLASLRRDY